MNCRRGSPAGISLVEPLVDGAVERSSERNLVGQRERQLTHVLLILVERDVVALELVSATLERTDDSVDDALRRLELHEVALQRRPDPGDHAQQLVEGAWLELEPLGSSFSTWMRRSESDLATGPPFLALAGEVAQRCLQHATARR